MSQQIPRLRKATLKIAALIALACAAFADPAHAQSDDVWRSLRVDVFGNREIRESSPLIRLTAPPRAEDAALVPIDIAAALPAGDPRSIARITLIVDENPVPVAASFRFGPGRHEASLSTRVRVNAYSFVRAIAETSDGELHMAVRYVKAAGGCSAPALKDQDESLARLGEMRLRFAAAGTAGARRAQLMIRHPNYSGLQMNQITRHYIPAKFVEQIVVRQDGELLFEMEGGISLSEDPVLGFDLKPGGADLHASAKDTDGRSFETRAGGRDGQF